MSKSIKRMHLKDDDDENQHIAADSAALGLTTRISNSCFNGIHYQCELDGCFCRCHNPEGTTMRDRDIFGPKLFVQSSRDGADWNHRKTFELNQRDEADAFMVRRALKEIGASWRIVITERQKPCWAF